jgi:hypothetical protein
MRGEGTLFRKWKRTSSRSLEAEAAVVESDSPTTAPIPNIDQDSFQWTPIIIFQTILLFLVAGLAEIGGGWLVWQTIREGKPAWW